MAWKTTVLSSCQISWGLLLNSSRSMRTPEMFWNMNWRFASVPCDALFEHQFQGLSLVLLGSNRRLFFLLRDPVLVRFILHLLPYKCR